MAPTRWPTDEDIAEMRRLEDERADLERERQTAREARTVTWSDGLRTQNVCELEPNDTHAAWLRAVGRRDALAAELADLESRLTAGELVQTGVPAPEYLEQKLRVEALRSRLG